MGAAGRQERARDVAGERASRAKGGTETNETTRWFEARQRPSRRCRLAPASHHLPGGSRPASIQRQGWPAHANGRQASDSKGLASAIFTCHLLIFSSIFFCAFPDSSSRWGRRIDRAVSVWRRPSAPARPPPPQRTLAPPAAASRTRLQPPCCKLAGDLAGRLPLSYPSGAPMPSCGRSASSPALALTRR